MSAAASPPPTRFKNAPGVGALARVVERSLYVRLLYRGLFAGARPPRAEEALMVRRLGQSPPGAEEDSRRALCRALLRERRAGAGLAGADGDALVAGLYWGVLGRAPDPAGARVTRRALAAGEAAGAERLHLLVSDAIARRLGEVPAIDERVVLASLVLGGGRPRGRPYLQALKV